MNDHIRGYLLRNVMPGEFSVCLAIDDCDLPLQLTVPIWLSADAPNGFTAGDMLDLSECDIGGCWRGVTYSFNQEVVIPNE